MKIMHLRILLLLLLKTSFSSFSLGQTSEKFNIEGTWSDSIETDGLGVRHGQTLVISGDTILIKKSGYNPILQLLKYKIIKDTLVGTEIEYIRYDGNIGLIVEHTKNRRSLLKIPICRLRNDCAEGVERGFQAYRKESNEHKIDFPKMSTKRRKFGKHNVKKTRGE